MLYAAFVHEGVTLNFNVLMALPARFGAPSRRNGQGSCGLFAHELVMAHPMGLCHVRLLLQVPRGGPWERTMDAAELKRWLASVQRLTPAQKAELVRALTARDDAAVVGELVESRMASLPSCPHCASTRIVRNGTADGLQRYECRGCQRRFNALSKTPLARLRMKSKWLLQEDVLARGLVVRLASAELGVAASTAFRWRHPSSTPTPRHLLTCLESTANPQTTSRPVRWVRGG